MTSLVSILLCLCLVSALCFSCSAQEASTGLTAENSNSARASSAAAFLSSLLPSALSSSASASTDNAQVLHSAEIHALDSPLPVNEVYLGDTTNVTIVDLTNLTNSLDLINSSTPMDVLAVNDTLQEQQADNDSEAALPLLPSPQAVHAEMMHELDSSHLTPSEREAFIATEIAKIEELSGEELSVAELHHLHQVMNQWLDLSAEDKYAIMKQQQQRMAHLMQRQQLREARQFQLAQEQQFALQRQQAAAPSAGGLRSVGVIRVPRPSAVDNLDAATQTQAAFHTAQFDQAHNYHHYHEL